MKPAGLSLTALCALASVQARAEKPLPGWSAESPSGHQKVWHATLDQRDLPPGARPALITAEVDTRGLWQGPADTPHITVSINGTVIGRYAAEPGGSIKIATPVPDRLLSTRNHIAIAVTSLGSSCPEARCRASAARLAGAIAIETEPATPVPTTFAQHMTRMREGLAIRAEGQRDRALAEAVAEALAPNAPRTRDGPATIVVSRDRPQGVAAPLRFDTGPVAIEDRDGTMVYDRARLDRFTIVQIARRGDTPLVWVRPGSEPLPAAPLDLDYGTIALFGAQGREIAFSPDQDHVLAIVYATDAVREAEVQFVWRLVVAAVWLAATAGLAIALRRTALARSLPVEA